LFSHALDEQTDGPLRHGAKLLRFDDPLKHTQHADVPFLSSWAQARQVLALEELAKFAQEGPPDPRRPFLVGNLSTPSSQGAKCANMSDPGQLWGRSFSHHLHCLFS